jgi:hypothetical protein
MTVSSVVDSYERVGSSAHYMQGGARAALTRVKKPEKVRHAAAQQASVATGRAER